MNKKIKVINFISNFEPFGGAQSVCLDHIELQLSLGYSVTLITGKANPVFLDKYKNVTIIIWPAINSSNVIYSVLFGFKLFNFLRVESPNFCVSHSTLAGIYSRIICRILKIRNVHTLHGFATLKKKYFGPLYKLLEKYMSFISDILICVSEHDLNLARAHNFLAKKNFLVYNTCSINYELNKEYKTNNHKLKLAMVARHSEQKDHKTLFKALNEFSSEEICVHLFGGGPDLLKNQMLASKIGLDNHVKFEGEVDNLDQVIINFDAVILISNMEGLPISLIEALSLSKPIIASNVGGCNEIVIEGFNGFLVPINDSNSLKSILSFLINNKYKLKDFGLNSKKVFDEKFSRNTFNKKIKIIYDNLINDEY